jgi:hypothetical protein
MADPAQPTGEVLVEAAQHHRQVLLLFASLPMPMLEQPLAGASEKLSAALGAGDADQGETPAPIPLLARSFEQRPRLRKNATFMVAAASSHAARARVMRGSSPLIRQRPE